MLWNDITNGKNINIKSKDNLLQKKKKCIEAMSKHIRSCSNLPPITNLKKNDFQKKIS